MIRIAIKNILFRPLNLLLSTVLFALGTALITTLIILNQQLGDQFEKNLAGVDLVIGAKGSPLQLILCNLYHIDAPTGNIPIAETRAFLNPKHPLIRQAVPLSLGDNYKGYRIVGTTSGFLLMYEHELESGRIWAEDFEVLIGAAVAEKAGLDIGSTFYSAHGFVDDEDLVHDYTEPFKVVGILKPTGTVLDQLILCTSETVWLVHAHTDEEEEKAEDLSSSLSDRPVLEKGYTEEELTDAHYNALSRLVAQEDMDITSVLVQFRGRNYQTLNMQRSINENTNMQAATPAIEINRLYAMMGIGVDALKVLAWIIMFVSGFSVFISLYSNLKDRKYELALMRVLGESRISVFGMILTEGLFLSLIGCLSGILLGHLAIFFFAGMMKESYKYALDPMVFYPEEIKLFLLAIAIGVLAAILPAIQAFRTDISKTLSGKG